MSAFHPHFCPHPACPSRAGTALFHYHRDGFFPRAVDGRRVQRFFCRACRRRFSAQTFRLDFRQRKPQINSALLGCFVSKVTHRQAARILKIDRKTVHRRLRLWGPALRELHESFLTRALHSGGLNGAFSLDEMETYEHDRRLRPVTVPVLIHCDTRFIVHFEVGQLPARGGLQGHDLVRKKLQGPRPSESTLMVRKCFETLKRVHDPGRFLHMIIDKKRSYRTEIRALFGNRISALITESSKCARNTSNPLFPINLTLAMLRDNVSRLVRRTWAASKLKAELVHHAWIYAAWKNYVRPVVNYLRNVSPAMKLGLHGCKLTPADLLRWRWPKFSFFAS
jgi:transposase-like protein